MKLSRAIEIETIHNDHNPNITDAEREQAHQLLIQAGNYIIHIRAFSLQHQAAKLKGETPSRDNPTHDDPAKRINESPIGRQSEYQQTS